MGPFFYYPGPIILESHFYIIGAPSPPQVGQMRQGDRDGGSVPGRTEKFEIIDLDVENFINGTLVPVMNNIKEELEKQGWKVLMHEGKSSSSLGIAKADREEFFVKISIVELDGRNRASMETRRPGPIEDMIKEEELITRSGEPADLSKISKEDIIHLFFTRFGKR